MILVHVPFSSKLQTSSLSVKVPGLYWPDCETENLAQKFEVEGAFIFRCLQATGIMGPGSSLLSTILDCECLVLRVTLLANVA
jgi:hypothetical protein